MAVTSGFYNSYDGDRKYDAIQFGSIFDGIIEDGVYMDYGDHFNVIPGGGLSIKISTGRAWFNHTWTLNDAVLVLMIPTPELLLDRIDAVVLEVNGTTEFRENTIKIITGTPSTTPTKPTLINEGRVHQYPLAYISVGPQVTDITASNIENAIGTSATPFATGILEHMSIDTLVTQWQSQFSDITTSWENQFEDLYADTQDTINTNLSNWAIQFNTWMDDTEDAFDEWQVRNKTEFEDWFDGIQHEIDQDTATRLANSILELKNANSYYSSKNVLKNDLKEVRGTGTGITFTENPDGSVTVNGTATGGDVLYVFTEDATTPNEFLRRISGKRVILSGCPAGGASTTYSLILSLTGTNGDDFIDTGSGIEVSIPDYTLITKTIIFIQIKENTVVNNLTFYPMLRLAKGTTDSYEPYAMTSVEVTKALGGGLEIEGLTYYGEDEGEAPVISDPVLHQSDVDDTLSNLSENPVENRVVTSAIREIEQDVTTIFAYAKSINDLSNKAYGFFYPSTEKQISISNGTKLFNFIDTGYSCNRGLEMASDASIKLKGGHVYYLQMHIRLVKSSTDASKGFYAYYGFRYKDTSNGIVHDGYCENSNNGFDGIMPANGLVAPTVDAYVIPAITNTNLSSARFLGQSRILIIEL